MSKKADDLPRVDIKISVQWEGKKVEMSREEVKIEGALFPREFKAVYEMVSAMKAAVYQLHTRNRDLPESLKKETAMSLPGTKLNSDPCLNCNHPRSAHDPYADSCVGGGGVGGGCRCEGFVEDDGVEDDEGEGADDGAA